MCVLSKQVNGISIRFGENYSIRFDKRVSSSCVSVAWFDIGSSKVAIKTIYYDAFRSLAHKMNALWFCYGWQVLICYSQWSCFCISICAVSSILPEPLQSGVVVVLCIIIAPDQSCSRSFDWCTRENNEKHHLKRLYHCRSHSYEL